MRKVCMLEQEVSVQLSDREPLSTTWNQRPVAGSWYCFIAATSFRRMVSTWSRLGWLAGTASSTVTVAIPYQPIARHQNSGECFVPGTTQLCVPDSSYACHSSPLGAS